jgi:hypothetical protein
MVVKAVISTQDMINKIFILDGSTLILMEVLRLLKTAWITKPEVLVIILIIVLQYQDTYQSQKIMVIQ